jgi:transposase
MMMIRDGRKLKRETQSEMRKRAVSMVHAGESPEKVAQDFGFHRSWIYRALKSFDELGEVGLNVHKATGRTPILDEKKKSILKKIILGKTPNQLKMEFALWTTDQVAIYIERRWGLALSISTITRTLHDLGLSFQKPLVKAFQQNPEAVQNWLDIEYPKIKRSAKKECAEIFFEDEAGLRSDHHSGKTWGEKGKTPVVKATGARFGFNVISAVNNNGKFCFMILDSKFNADKFIDFLSRLIKYKRKKIYLIVDGHPVHKAVKVKNWIENNKEKIKLFFLPSYSPELNPTELAWNCLKTKMGKKTIVGPDNMKTIAVDILNSFENDPELITSLYREKHVKYAA